MIAAVLIAAAALYVIRRHARSREKLQNLTAHDTEASKDYQVGLLTFPVAAAGWTAWSRGSWQMPERRSS